jgi:Cys-tRNA(Pro)/Cys-tRNA(Cys) deacylase
VILPDAETVIPGDTFDSLLKIVATSGAPFIIHEHKPSRTMEDAEQYLSFEIARIVKTVAFRIRDGGVVLAVLRGSKRVDYPKLAALAGVNRRELSPLSPEDVKEILGVEPGSVSPLMQREGAALFIDDDLLTILPTVYCGIGRPDRTLEIAAVDLVKITCGRIGGFSR